MSARTLALLATLAALAGAPLARATEAPVATASSQDDTAAQIDAYLRSSPTTRLEADGPDGVVSSAQPDRAVHGEVAVSVGSGGYRSVYARSDFPVGKTGVLSVAIEDAQGSGRYGRYGGDGRNLGMMLSLGGTAPRDRGEEGLCRGPGFGGFQARQDDAATSRSCRPPPRGW